MKINCHFWKIAIFFSFFCFSGLFPSLGEGTEQTLPPGESAVVHQAKPSDAQKESPITNLLISPNSANWKKDGLPLVLSLEWNDISGILAYLGKFSSRTLEEQSFGQVGFISLNRQSKGWRGRIITVKGRLLRTEYLSVPEKKENSTPQGFYESWILLDDEKSIPVRLLSRTIPDQRVLAKVQPEETTLSPSLKSSDSPSAPSGRLYRQDIVLVTGIYYRLTSYPAGNDFYNSPTLVSFGFELLSSGDVDVSSDLSLPVSNATDFSNHWQVYGGLLFVIIVWILVRSWLRGKYLRGKQKQVTDTHPETLDIEVLRQLDRNRPNLVFIPILVAIFFVPAAEGQLVKESSQSDKPALLSLKKEKDNDKLPDTPGGIVNSGYYGDQSESREELRLFLERLGRVSDPLILENGVEPVMRTNPNAVIAFWKDFKSHRMQSVPFRGILRSIEKKEFPASSSNKIKEGDSDRFFYRLEIEPSESELRKEFPRLSIYSNAIPDFEINRTGRAGLTGNTATEKGIGQMVTGIGWFLSDRDGVKVLPVLATNRLGWLPEGHPLSQLGMDLALLEEVPVFSPKLISRIGKKDTSGKSPVSPELTGKILTSLRFTQNDRLPFYSMLTAVSKAESGLLRQWATQRSPSTLSSSDQQKTESFPAVELFNRPERYQAEPVFLRGKVRRLETILVTDREIIRYYGRDRYYQLYLYTDDSQGVPIVISVPELPKGMPTGTGADYREEVSLAAFFYKTWTYRVDLPAETRQRLTNSASSVSDRTDQSTAGTDLSPIREKKNWIRVPCLIGSDVQWYPAESDDNTSSGSGFPFQLHWTILSILLVVYIGYRLLRGRKNR